MHKPNLDNMARRVLSDPGFREQFMADPQRALSEAGYDFPPDDVAALEAWHANLRNVTKIEELERALAEFIASRAHQAS
ncbi:MAG: Os1348 family NHLP clan protein [Armatimonadota bacterium]